MVRRAVRREVPHEFNRRDYILVATDAAAEGLNLHHRCRIVVHYELPWSTVSFPISYRLSPGAGPKTVYFQVRSYRSVVGGEIETVSAIASDSITLVR